MAEQQKRKEALEQQHKNMSYQLVESDEDETPKKKKSHNKTKKRQLRDKKEQSDSDE